MNSSRYFFIECIYFCVCEVLFFFYKFLIMNFENYKMFYWIKVGFLI